ncbi:hypothetical protein Nepgr_031115 [Nepenthes gracilis]|uniref:Uncharacterized protein n=1 Tax=Nepenthes gracilis TaxID=150966 RepID=A0AAD3TGX3_NEPGR|nr:hypothetical protein Nepgr_031115 [Nepenthes gracilis]
MLMRNIDELRKQMGASKAGVLEVSYNHGQSLLDGSSMQSCSELPGARLLVMDHIRTLTRHWLFYPRNTWSMMWGFPITGELEQKLRPPFLLTAFPLLLMAAGIDLLSKKPKRRKKKHSPSSFSHIA